jgi:hypothetical protein
MEIVWKRGRHCVGYCGFCKHDCVAREVELTYGRSRIEVEYEMQNNKENMFLSRMNRIKDSFVYIRVQHSAESLTENDSTDLETCDVNSRNED